MAIEDNIPVETSKPRQAVRSIPNAALCDMPMWAIHKALVAVTLPYMFTATVASIYLVANWETYKGNCYILDDQSGTTKVFGTQGWLATCTLWATNLTVGFCALRMSCGGPPPRPRPRRPKSNDVDDSQRTAATCDDGTLVGDSNRRDNNNDELEMDPVDVEEGTPANDSSSQENKAKPAPTNRSPAYFQESSPWAGHTSCFFQIALPFSLVTTLIFLLPEQPYELSPEFDNERCISSHSAVVARDAPAAELWLAMDMLVNATTQVLCTVFLLLFYITKCIPYNYSQWFIASFASIAMMLINGLTHNLRFPTLDFWILSLEAVMACTIMEGILKLIWNKFLSGKTGN